MRPWAVYWETSTPWRVGGRAPGGCKVVRNNTVAAVRRKGVAKGVLSLWFRGRGITLLSLLGARNISVSSCQGYKKPSTAIFLINPALASARLRSPLKKHFQGKMAAKGVFCFVLISALATLATSLPWEGRSKPLCDCINPFVGTRNAYR